MLDTFRQDTRYAGKLLARDRGFTAAALLTLALCIGANTAIFSVVDAVLFEPLPFHEPDELVTIFNSYPNAGAPRASNGVPDFYDRRELAAFESLALYNPSGATIGEAGSPERVAALRATPSLFTVLGTEMLRGRTFTADEGERGNHQRAILSWGLWQERFAGRDDAIGTTLRVDGEPYTIVGVLPRGFLFADPDARLVVPLAFTAEQRSDDARHSNSWQMIGRLAPGVSVARAQQEVDALNGRLEERFPQFTQLLRDVGFHTQVHAYRDDLTRDVRGTLLLLQGGVLLVLLIGCVNIANLVLVRSTGRVRELATRSALGAEQARLTRQLLTESVLLGVIGGVLGVGLGALGVELLTTLGADALPRAGAIGLDLRVLAATLVLAIAAGTLSGLIPIVRLRRIDLSTIFRDEGRSGTASRGTLATRAALVVTQLGVAFALLVAAGLLLVSFGRTLAVDPGFRPEGVLTARVALPVTRYADGPARRAFFTRVLADVRRIPGVEAAGLTNVLPFTGDYNSSVMHAEGYEVQPGESLLSPISTVASDGYFEALGLRLVRGRTFEAGDLEDRQPVAIIDRWLAERYWPGRDPVGLRMTQGAPGVVPDSLLEYRTVVGIVEDVRVGNLTGEQTNGHYYFPLAQQPVGGAFLALRTGGDPLALLPALRRTVAAIDPELPVYSVETMPDRISDSVRTERARAFLIAAFAAVALFLAAVGIYGVLAYSVAQRRGEIGIRVALGSSRGDVFRLVVGQGARMVVAGLVVGGVGSVALARALRSMLYGVGPADPRVFAAVLVVLSATALAACLLPARRAMRVDPMTALRD